MYREKILVCGGCAERFSQDDAEEGSAEYVAYGEGEAVRFRLARCPYCGGEDVYEADEDEI